MKYVNSKSLTFGLLAVASQAYAQGSLAVELEEIVVTATKRTEALSSVPITVNAFSAAEIKEAGLENLQDVAILTPSLKAPYASSPFGSRISIRGIGTYQTDPALEPSVGLFIDGVFLGRSGLGLADLTDIERIEVLQGPQGTLYGKNANAGAISVVTKNPNLERFEADFEATAGDYDLRQFKGSVSGPLSESFAYRLAGSTGKRDGYYNNAGGDDLSSSDDWSLQSKLYWEPSADLSVLLNVSHLQRDNTCCGSDAAVSDATNQALVNAGYSADKNDPYDFEIAVDHDSAFTTESDSASLTIDYSLPSGELKSITAWNDHNFTSNFDADRTLFDVMAVDHYSEGNSLSQEIRFTSNPSNDFEYQVGFFYLNQEIQRGDSEPFAQIGSDFATIAALNGLPATIGLIAADGDYIAMNSVLETETYALFSQFTWHLNDGLHVTGGLRYTEESKDADLFVESVSTAPLVVAGVADALLDGFVTPIDAELDRKSNNLDYMLRISKDIGEDSMVFASFSTGTKSGGINTSTGGVEDREFDDEYTTNYEVGFKYKGLENTLRVNATAFYTVIDDFQFQTQLPSGVGLFISNDAQVQVAGLDVQFESLPHENVRLFGGLLYMDKYEVTDGENAGDTLDYVAEWSFNMGATVSFPLRDGNVYWRTDYSYMSEYKLTALEQDESIFNTRLGWRSESWDISLWGKNITNEEYALEAPHTFAFTGTDAINLASPRTIGLTVNYSL